MSETLKIIVVLVGLAVLTSVDAGVPIEMQKEVDHLFTYIKQSNCVIERNDTKHPAVEAVDHIKEKYGYFRDKIKSTEDFIEYSATKSTVSDKPYMVYCEGKKIIPSKEWLLKELMEYRLRGAQP